MAKTRAEKPIVSDLAFMQLNSLPAEDQVAIRRMIESDSRMRKLAIAADRAGPNDMYRVVKGPCDLFVIFEISAEHVTIVSIVTQRAMDFLSSVSPTGTNGVHPKPSRKASAKRLKV